MNVLSVRNLNVSELDAMERRLKAEREALDKTYIQMGEKILGMALLTIHDLYGEAPVQAFQEVWDGYSDIGYDKIKQELEDRGIELAVKAVRK